MYLATGKSIRSVTHDGYIVYFLKIFTSSCTNSIFVDDLVLRCNHHVVIDCNWSSVAYVWKRSMFAILNDGFCLAYWFLYIMVICFEIVWWVHLVSLSDHINSKTITINKYFCSDCWNILQELHKSDDQVLVYVYLVIHLKYVIFLAIIIMEVINVAALIISLSIVSVRNDVQIIIKPRLTFETDTHYALADTSGDNSPCMGCKKY